MYLTVIIVNISMQENAASRLILFKRNDCISITWKLSFFYAIEYNEIIDIKTRRYLASLVFHKLICE